MATQGVINATNVKLWIQDGENLKYLAHSTSITLNFSVEMRDVSGFASQEWRKVKPARLRWDISGDNFLSFNAAYGYRQLFNAWKNGTAVTIEFHTMTIGDYEYTGTIKINSLNLNASERDSVRFSFTGVAYSDLTEELIEAFSIDTTEITVDSTLIEASKFKL